MALSGLIWLISSMVKRTNSTCNLYLYCIWTMNAQSSIIALIIFINNLVENQLFCGSEQGKNLFKKFLILHLKDSINYNLYKIQYMKYIVCFILLWDFQLLCYNFEENRNIKTKLFSIIDYLCSNIYIRLSNFHPNEKNFEGSSRQPVKLSYIFSYYYFDPTGRNMIRNVAFTCP